MDKRKEIVDIIMSRTTSQIDNTGEPEYVLSQIDLDDLIDSLVKFDLLHPVIKCSCNNRLAKPISPTEYECVNCGEEC